MKQYIMNSGDAKQIDMVGYLETLGITPSKISGNNYWYLSPLHQEKTASFKINRHLNRWYDFAEGSGGNLIDFGIRFHNCSVSNFLRRLSDRVYSEYRQQTIARAAEPNSDNSNHITVISAGPLRSLALLNYLHTRRIGPAVADAYLKEVNYQLAGKNYYALGFKNDAGGYELRNHHIKASSSPKDTTFMNNGSTDIAVFEGFFNFLSYKNMYYKQEEPLRNFLVLNSASFFDKSLSKLQEHDHVHLYLDNDKTGQRITQRALDLDKKKFTDERALYTNFNDLNDWIVKIGNPLKHQLRKKL